MKARPSHELIERQRVAKERWRREMASRPFREKLAILLEMQKRLLPVLAQRRKLHWWERPWPIDP